jgi:RNA polymerase sigma-70 factor (ECF subfamily)
MAIDGSSADVFNRFSREVYGWAYRLLGHHHDALDIAQDVFLRWTRQCRDSEPRCARAWLRRVTLNRSIDLRRQRRAVAVTEDELDHRSAPRVLCGMNSLDVETLRHDVTAGLAKLSDLQRSVLVAKVYDEMTFAEIAAELDVAVSTAKTHYLRAVRTIRDRLQSRWSDEVLQ